MSVKLRPHAATAAALALALILTFAVVALVASSGAQAAKQPKCGDTITKDTTLHKDLVNCPNNGIIIGADGVTLDLNGHRIDGDGTAAAGCNPRKEFCDVGVGNDGHDGVTVRHGSMREFDVGAVVRVARHNRLLGISSSRNQFAGIVVVEAVRSLVRNSSGNGSITPEGGTGIYLVASHHVRVLDSSFRNNGDRGIAVFDSTHNLIKGNLLSRNTGPGIVLDVPEGQPASGDLSSDRNRVRGNRSVRDGGGIDLGAANRNVIARNRIAHAIKRRGRAPAITVCCGNHNVIARNSVRDAEGHGIDLGFGGGVGNVVRRNHIHGAGKDGVHVLGKAKHTLLTRNHAFGAEGDGLDTNSSTTKLTRNEASRNGDLGIEAVRGVIDGGGNIARHNGDPRQCTNIACS